MDGGTIFLKTNTFHIEFHDAFCYRHIGLVCSDFHWPLPYFGLLSTLRISFSIFLFHACYFLFFFWLVWLPLAGSWSCYCAWCHWKVCHARLVFILRLLKRSPISLYLLWKWTTQGLWHQHLEQRLAYFFFLSSIHGCNIWNKKTLPITSFLARRPRQTILLHCIYMTTDENKVGKLVPKRLLQAYNPFYHTLGSWKDRI